MGRKIDRPLWEYTRDLHHACEAHEVGGAMAAGNPPKIWYAAWCNALATIHAAIDPHCDAKLRRAPEADSDVRASGYRAEDLKLDTPQAYVDQLSTKEKIDGAIYVLTGAHLMGGEIMRRRLNGYPTAHLEWDDRKGALTILQQYRTRNDIGDEARECFQALLDIMDEIATKFPQ